MVSTGSRPPGYRKRLKMGHIVRARCPHCGTVTPQARRKRGEFMDACLQCIADGGTCCSLSDFNRWVAA